jgi:sugar porter (SP) family MFS transporter
MTDLGVAEPRRINKGVLYFFGALGGILFGYDIGVISGVLLFIEKSWNLSYTMDGVVGACFAFGAMFGAAIGSRWIDRLGRRRSIMLGGAIFGIGTLGCLASPDVGLFVAFRFIAGFGVGVTSATIPAYLSELAPRSTRGALSALNQLMIVGGVAIAYGVDWALSSSGDWRLMIAFGLVPVVMLLIGMPFLPETPRWLLMRGREQEARRVIRAAQGDVDIDREVKEIQTVIKLDTTQRGNLRDLVRPWALPALLIALLLGVGQQFSGVNAINVYAPTMFKALGASTSSSLGESLAIGVAKVLLTIWVIFVVDKWGRRPLLLVGSLFMAAMLAALGVVVTTVQGGSGFAVLLFIAYLAGYELGWGAIVWLMVSEVFPLRVRGVGMSVTSTALWAATFMVTLVFPIMDHHIGLAGSSWIFAGINIVLFILVLAFVPETKGRSLEQIELDMRHRIGLRHGAAAIAGASDELTSPTDASTTHDKAAV